MSAHFPSSPPPPSPAPEAQSRFNLSEELSLLPRWSVLAAVFAFVLMQWIFWVLLPAHHHHDHESPPFGLRLYFALSWSALAALYMLMVGYICRDSGRRGMQARFWIVLCLVLPGGIGAVLYFLLRQPLISLCPACSTRVETNYHFCPQCAFQISASCGRCYRSVRPTDLFCVHCGHDRVTDNLPERLLALRD